MSLSTRKGGTSYHSFGWLAKKHGFSEEEVIDMDARYKHADLDRSGQLDREELKNLLHSTIAVQMTQLQINTYLNSQWHNVDRDGNGAVDFDEFLALYAILKLEAKSRRPLKRPAPASAGTAAATAVGGTAAPPTAVETQVAAKPGTPGFAKFKASKKAEKEARKVAKAAREKKKADRKQKPKKRRKVQKSFTPSSSLTTPNYISNEIVWSVLRKNHAYLVKRDGVTFSSERGNLRNTHGFRGSGLANSKTVDLRAVEAAVKSGDVTAGAETGLTLRLRAASRKRQTKPRRLFYSQVLNRDNRGVARQLKKRLVAYGRPDLTNAVLARMTRLKAVSGGVTKKTQKTKARRTANK